MGFEGRLTALGLVKEGTWGTDPTGTTTTIPLRSGTLDEDSTFKDYDDLYAGSTGVVRGRSELARDCGGATSVLLGYSVIGLMLEAMFGAVAESGAGPYVHTFTMADPDSLPSYTGRMRLGTSTTMRVMTGLMVTKGTIKWKARDFTTLDLEWIGQSVDSFTGGSPGTPAVAMPCLPNHSGVVAWNSVNYSDIVSMDWIIDHKLGRTPVIGSLKTQQPQPGSRPTCMVNFTARFTASEYSTLYASMKAGTQSSLTVTLTSGSNSIAMTLDNAQLTSLRGDLTGAGPVMVNGTFEGTHDGTGSDGMRCVLTNGHALYST